jgi:hypothetical protein
MSEETTETREADNASQSSPATDTYPPRDSENGEEQRNRLGYMATEPTVDEIEEGDDKAADDKA